MTKKLYFLFLNIFILVLNTKCDTLTDKRETRNPYFIMNTYNIDDEFIERRRVEYDFNNKGFINQDALYLQSEVKTIVICNEDDIDKSDEEKKTILFWNTATIYDIYSSIIYLSVYPLWYYKQKEKDDIYCFKIVGVGWIDNVNKPICKDPEAKQCPDMIILGTTQFAYRYDKSGILSLNKYFTKYTLKNGNSIESRLNNKYAQLDYRVDDNWLAVPVIIDLRTFRFNVTTFDNCISKGYNLHYPPPLSDYWGPDYKKTWTWAKVIEYAEMITKCTGQPGYQLIGSKSEDMKLFIIICQSLGIPFFFDDQYKNKMCGFRSTENIKKLSILRKLFEEHYIDKWLDEGKIKKWQSLPYPSSVEKQPIFPLIDKLRDNYGELHGMVFDLITNAKYVTSDVELSYMPGTSSFLGGSGISITKDSKYADQLFEYIEILIDKSNPFLLQLNDMITPYEDIHLSVCDKAPEKKTNKTLCNSLLFERGIFPYYYLNNNEIDVIYINHTATNNNRGILFSISGKYNQNQVTKDFINSLNSKEYMCDEEANYNRNTITYVDPYRIKLPISSNQVLILKSMKDYNGGEVQLITDNRCSIIDETIKNAKPIQFPYNTFSQLNEFETRSPISILFAHLYYKHNNTNEGSFEAIINECCDIIDDSLTPLCKGYKNIIFEPEECHKQEQIRKINYKNCKLNDTDKLPTVLECPYITPGDTKGLVLTICTIIGLLIEVFFIAIVLKFENVRCISAAGPRFLLCLFISCMILDLSVLFWIGVPLKYKCILRIWTMIIGITGLICSYSIKSEFIISVYNNHNIRKSAYQLKSYMLYIIILVIQFILLVIWTLTQEGITTIDRYVNEIGFFFKENTCSIGSEYALNPMFGLDFILLMLSILMSYRGRNIPAEFNYSKKIFITSLFSLLLLSLYYMVVIIDIEKPYPYFIFLSTILLISLTISILFIGNKVLILLNINIDTEFSIMVYTNGDSNRESNDYITEESKDHDTTNNCESCDSCESCESCESSNGENSDESSEEISEISDNDNESSQEELNAKNRKNNNYNDNGNKKNSKKKGGENYHEYIEIQARSDNREYIPSLSMN
ncbi:hypothetical protein BCR32DRAFT_272429 [Anaeromyces robustus]|uniref:G-protein coupled receptors family 3 profile domain-containing protein n=1 Tax=Anaeromyces robustus TaxID=1754192 RepID=A0A1Y1W9I3_9FUNG|nr:hypothetical protein BCR32DRAFT_272429 [Anaeromyces robustus]|eukprot:ORX69814.1 hypothetical protein BCR32DRAFT_272429 [Anaeromyces robustus]